MSAAGDRKPAVEPEDLGLLFVERANAGDVDGLVRLYEPRAVLAMQDGARLTGTAAIREFYQQILAGGRRFSGQAQCAVRVGDLALTSTRFSGGATAEIARRQPDGTWLWIADQPNILG